MILVNQLNRRHVIKKKILISLFILIIITISIQSLIWTSSIQHIHDLAINKQTSRNDIEYIVSYLRRDINAVPPWHNDKYNNDMINLLLNECVLHYDSNSMDLLAEHIKSINNQETQEIIKSKIVEIIHSNSSLSGVLYRLGISLYGTEVHRIVDISKVITNATCKSAIFFIGELNENEVLMWRNDILLKLDQCYKSGYMNSERYKAWRERITSGLRLLSHE